MNFILNLLLQGLLALLAAYLLPGVFIESYLDALLVVLVLAFANAFVRPVLTFLTLPITILTLGLFLIVIDGLIVLLADALLSGFSVKNLIWAVLFAAVLALLDILVGELRTRRSERLP